MDSYFLIAILMSWSDLMNECTIECRPAVSETMFAEYPDILTVKDLTKMLGIGRNTAYKLLGDGLISSFRIGSTHKIVKKSVVDYVTSVF
jgi:excisionase family DNA binding protein